MKRAVKLAILGAMLQGGVQAAPQDVVVEPSLSAAHHTRSAQPVAKKQKAARSKKHKAARSGKVKSKPGLGVGAADPKPADKPDAVIQTLPEAVEQSIQLKGVRG